MVNEGKRPMYVDGKPLLPGSKTKLNNNAVIEVSEFYNLIHQGRALIMRLWISVLANDSVGYESEIIIGASPH